MEEFMRNTWSKEYEDELVRELLDDELPLFMVPPEMVNAHSNPSNESSINRLVSDVYSGPRIEDIGSALSVTSYANYSEDFSGARTSILERGLSKVENKYTLKIKSCGNVMADDGYKWRKYGQKSIKNSLNPRSYYRCTNPRCGAKKQVERSGDDPDTLIITYEGLHLHYAYPFFQLNQTDHVNPPVKKPKKSIPQAQAHEAQEIQEVEESPSHVGPGPPPTTFVDYQDGSIAQEVMGSQGLLEDVVPLIIRNPLINNTSPNSSSCSSHPSPPTSPIYFSWSPNYYSPSCFDIGM